MTDFRTSTSLTQPCILTINCGSSSIKFALFEVTSLRRIFEGKIERIGHSEARFIVRKISVAETISNPVMATDHAMAATLLIDWCQQNLNSDMLIAVAHRIVHGGPDYWQTQRITPNMMDELRGLARFSPMHLPAELMMIEAFENGNPQLIQFACFDTAFHHDMPQVAKMLPIPRRYQTQGIHRYGFHGLSYAYLLHELERLAGVEIARGRIVFAHLGNGASMAAVREKRPIDTSMGLTPAAGLVMGTRSGDLDPGLFSFLADSENMTAEQFNHMVNYESGLLGLSETSADMHDLLALGTEDIRASEAVALFCYQAKKCIGAYTAAIGGLDTLVFSGGIGENSAEIRARICEGLEFMGIQLDSNLNVANAAVVSSSHGKVEIRVIPTDEEWMMAHNVSDVLNLITEKESHDEKYNHKGGDPRATT